MPRPGLLGVSLVTVRHAHAERHADVLRSSCGPAGDALRELEATPWTFGAAVASDLSLIFPGGSAWGAEKSNSGLTLICGAHQSFLA
jgi:hypothetical protein